MPQYTQKQMQEMFLKHCRNLVEYWANESRVTDVKEKLSGLMFSLLVTLDGETLDFPAFELIPAPHPDDKEFHESRGENYWPPLPEDFKTREDIVNVHGQQYLHDLYSQSKRQEHGEIMNTDKIEKINVVEVVKNLATGGSLPTRNMSKQLLAELLLDAWSALNTLKEMANLRSDVEGFKAVIKNHLPEEYIE